MIATRNPARVRRATPAGANSFMAWSIATPSSTVFPAAQQNRLGSLQIDH
jgi:hypothetical protein